MTTEEILDALPSTSVTDLYLISSACLTQLSAVAGDSTEIQSMNGMTRQRFCSIVAQYEGKRSETSIGNVREIVRIINQLTGGGLDVLIRNTEDPDMLVSCGMN